MYVAYVRLRAKIGWEVVPPGRNELERLIEEAGFSEITSDEKRFGRDYAPVEFPSFFISDQSPRVREEHDSVERLRSRHGIGPTLVIMVSGKNEV